jgi:excisionase family DNA binding protein
MENATTKTRLTTVEAADVLEGDVCVRTILNWITKGFNGRKLPALKIGKNYRIDSQDLTDFVAEMQPEANLQRESE